MKEKCVSSPCADFSGHGSADNAPQLGGGWLKQADMVTGEIIVHK
jgi:hypothetical protein